MAIRAESISASFGIAIDFDINLEGKDVYKRQGTNSVRRIIKARQHAKLSFTDLKKMGVVLKRALYFITCDGRMMYLSLIHI